MAPRAPGAASAHILGVCEQVFEGMKAQGFLESQQVYDLKQARNWSLKVMLTEETIPTKDTWPLLGLAEWPGAGWSCMPGSLLGVPPWVKHFSSSTIPGYLFFVP